VGWFCQVFCVFGYNGVGNQFFFVFEGAVKERGQVNLYGKSAGIFPFFCTFDWVRNMLDT